TRGGPRVPRSRRPASRSRSPAEAGRLCSADARVLPWWILASRRDTTVFMTAFVEEPPMQLLGIVRTVARHARGATGTAGRAALWLSRCGTTPRPRRQGGPDDRHDDDPADVRRRPRRAARADQGGGQRR